MTCWCGHVEDKHTNQGVCEMLDCPCFSYEEADREV